MSDIKKLLNRKRKDYSGNRYNLLVADSYKYSIKGKSFWNFNCDCGNTIIKRIDVVIKSIKSNCGCLYTYKNKTRIKDGGYRAACVKVYHHYLQSAKRRKYIFNLSLEDFIKISSSDCHYCGLVAKKTLISSKNNKVGFTYNGVDRKDNKKGYNLQNCLPCCEICNRAKMKTSYEDFISYLNRIKNHLNNKDVT